MQSYIVEAIEHHKLPTSFGETVTRWYQPLAAKVAAKAKSHKTALVMGVQGTQGSGKSTLADFLRLILQEEHNLNCAILSIDDFYLTRAERTALSQRIHPLLKTRGVPGTHDVQLATSTIHTLLALTKDDTFNPVRFNKAIDDRETENNWPSLTGPIDIIILEGWCVGLAPQHSADLSSPINRLEEIEDSDAVWRLYANQQLSGPYHDLFGLLDCLAVLKAPSFNCVYHWRLLQEQKLEARLKQMPSEQQSNNNILSPEEIERFISHYQRLTEHALNTLPEKADWLLPLGEDHQILDLISNKTDES